MENRIVGTLAKAAAMAAVMARKMVAARSPFRPTPPKMRRGKSSETVGLRGFPSVRNMQRNLNRGLWSPPPVTDQMRARHDWFYRPKAAKS